MQTDQNRKKRVSAKTFFLLVLKLRIKMSRDWKRKEKQKTKKITKPRRRGLVVFSFKTGSPGFKSWWGDNILPCHLSIFILSIWNPRRDMKRRHTWKMMPRMKQFVPLNCFEFEGLNIGKVTSSGDRDQREDGSILDNNSIKRSKLNL